MKSRVLLISIIIMVLVCTFPVYAQDTTTINVKFKDYSFDEGEYQWIFVNGQKDHIVNNPAKKYTLLAKYDGVIEFTIIESLDKYKKPILIVENEDVYHYFGKYSVKAGTVLDITLMPGNYNTLESGRDDGTPNDYTYHYPYNAQAGEIHYSYTYLKTDDGPVEPETSVSASFTYSPEVLVEGTPITFTSTSTAIGGTIPEFYWYVNDEYVTEAAMKDSWTWTNAPVGTHTVELTVIDSNHNEDHSDPQTITVWPDQSWIMLDTATCDGLQDSVPLNRMNIFNDQESVTAWAKLGDVSGPHTVTFEWKTPVGSIVQTNSVDIPDAKNSGYDFWEEYSVYDELSSEELGGNPGDWSIDLHVDGEKVTTLEFTVWGEPTLLAGTDKDKYITGEEVVFEGQLFVGNIPQQYMDVSIVINRNNQVVDSVMTSTNLDGLFEYKYRVRPGDGITEEDWSYKAEAMEKKAEGSFKVLPVKFEVNEMYLIQTSEVPFIDYGGTFTQMVAADREMAVRVKARCPTLKNQEGYKPPTVRARLTLTDRGGYSEEVFSSGELSEEWSDIDFFFTPWEGWMDIRFTLDPDYQYGDWFDAGDEYVQSLSVEKSVLGKKMEPVDIQFVQVDYPFTKKKVGQILARRFYKQQENFLKQVYPVPEEMIRFREDYSGTSAKGLLQYTPFFKNPRLYGQLKWLSLRAFMDGGKVVGVLPHTSDWWPSTVSGYASFVGRTGYVKWIDEYAPYFTRAVLTHPNANEGVTAHEIAHTLGLNIYKGEEEYQLNPDNGNRVQGLAYKNGRIYNLTVEAEVREGFKTIVGQECQQVYCFMGSNMWIHGDMKVGTWVCEETAIELFEALMDPPHIPLLYVQGDIINGTVTFDDFYTGHGLPDPSYGGHYQAQILDGNGNVLDEISFGFKDAQVTQFGFVTEFPPETVKIVMKSGDVILGEKIRSNNAPVVTVLYPSGGNYVTDSTEVYWQGTDQDGDELRYTLQYSNDDGQSWRMIDTGITATNMTLDLSGFPGGQNCMVKVVASDGFNTGEHVSGSFQVANNEPYVEISSPMSGETIGADSVSLIGFSMDVESILGEGQHEWYSNLDGFLGYGESLTTELSEGAHELTLKVTDDEGVEVSDIVTVTVSQVQVELVSHTICGGFDAQGTPTQVKSQYSSTETINSLVSLSGITVGQQVYWVFSNDNITQNSEFIANDSGDLTVNAYLELDKMQSPEVNGEWTIQVFVDGVSLDTKKVDVIEVNEKTGFAWWGGLAGIVVVGAIMAGGYMFIKGRKKDTPSEPVRAPVEPVQANKFCDNCGKPATWIEQYNRWYCYDCEKYLE